MELVEELVELEPVELELVELEPVLELDVEVVVPPAAALAFSSFTSYVRLIVFVQDVVAEKQLGRLINLTILVLSLDILYTIIFIVDKGLVLVAVIVIVCIFFGGTKDNCGSGAAGLGASSRVSSRIIVNGYSLSI